MVHSRRAVLKATGGAIGVATLAGCNALTGGDGSEYPSETVEIVIPMSAGGGNDTYMRPLADPLSEELDVDVTATNQPPPTERYTELYNQSDDGYSITVFNPTAFMPLALEEGSDSWANASNWHSLGAPSTSSMVLNIRGDAEASSWDEAVAMSEDEDHTWRVGNLGAPSQGPYFDLMTQNTPIQLDTIEGFESTAEIVAAMERGEVDMNLGPASSMLGFVEEGTVIPILTAEDSVLGEPILDAYAEIDFEGVAPSFTEKGIGEIGILAQTLRAVLAPPEVSDDRVETLRDGVWSAIQSDAYQESLQEADLAIFNPVSSEDLADLFVQKEEARGQL